MLYMKATIMIVGFLIWCLRLLKDRGCQRIPEKEGRGRGRPGEAGEGRILEKNGTGRRMTDEAGECWRRQKERRGRRKTKEAGGRKQVKKKEILTKKDRGGQKRTDEA